MAKNYRLHQVAKALGMATKVLMNELASKGFEYKTHMASIDDEALATLEKKHSNLKKDLAELEAKKPAPAKKKKKKKTASSKSQMITSRTQAKDEPASAVKKTPAKSTVEIVKDNQGDTVEQKVIRGGILRRRRVEPTEPPAESPAPPQKEEAQTTEVEVEKSPTLPEEPTSPELSEEQVVEESPVETTEAPQEEKQVQEKEKEGRNLSAGRRLKVVAQSKMPLPKEPVKKAKPAVKTSSGEAEKPAAAAKPGDKAADASKKKSLKNWTAPKVTKRDLIGMTEEVEITRPRSRRAKKTTARSDRKTKITTPGAAKRRIKIEGEIAVADLADRMGVKAADVVRKLIGMGQMVSAQQPVDFETASLIAAEYEYEVVNVDVTAESLIQENTTTAVEKDDPEDLVERAPMVTIMGHVDHGKTSLLDYIRKSRVVAGEAGGITQHIGAYQIERNKKKITFLDTPGHEAFTKMRARGAQTTDIVILVVAADEGTKPQTLEALAHARSAEVPIIVAVNKIDKPEANPDRVMQELSSHELVPEAWGGDTIFVNVSAHSGEGVEGLLEMILLQAEVLELKANPSRQAAAIVIESQLDKGRGAVATLVVREGTMEKGQPIVSGTAYGKIRAMFNDKGKPIKKAGPSTPVEVLGFNSVPEVGEVVNVVTEESVARKSSDLALEAKKREEQRRAARVSLEEMYAKMKAGEMNELRVVLKADVQGSLEALADALAGVNHEKVKINVIFKAVGGVTESDISLAAASGALVLGFNVRPTSQAKQLASQENVQIKSYSVIYELIDDVKLAMQGLLDPVIKENILGQAEVRDVFNLTKFGIVAGCFVKSGKVQRNAMGRLIRDSVVIYDTRIDSLKRFKEDAREVSEGFECGIKLENFTDIKVGDVIECYEKVEMSQAMSS